MEDMFDNYTCDGINQIYFCLRNGFENEKPIAGKNAPLDNYGLSMISVIVNENGELAYCTTRWNHENGGNDGVMSAKKISQVVGVNFYQVFKPNNKWVETLENAKHRIANGEPLDSVFDEIGEFKEGLARIKLNKKFNFIKSNGEFLTNKWFSYANDFTNGFAVVRLNNNKWNYIKPDGKYLNNKLFDFCHDFHEGFGIVNLDFKNTYIKPDGDYLVNKWFKYCFDFKNGFAIAGSMDGTRYEINKNGELFKLVNENKHSNTQNVLIAENDLHNIIKDSIKKLLKNG
jgi:hypothetical protein